MSVRTDIWSAGSYAVPPQDVSWLPANPVTAGRDGDELALLADPHRRIDAQRRDGLAGEVLHPHPALVETLRASTDEAARQLASSYNEWIAGHVATDPARLVGIGLVPRTGLDDALVALEQSQRLGLPGVALDEPPAGPTTSPGDADDFWDQAAGRTVVCLGAGFGGGELEPEPRVAAGRAPAVAGFLTRLALSGIVDDHPGIRLLLVNQEAGWLPYVLEGSDTNYMRTAASRAVSLGDPDALPSEYVRRITWATFQEDRFAVIHRRFFGEMHLLYSASLAGPASRWPGDEEAAERICEGLDLEARDRLLAANCRRLFGVGDAAPFTPEEIDDFQQAVVA